MNGMSHNTTEAFLVTELLVVFPVLSDVSVTLSKVCGFSMKSFTLNISLCIP